MNESCYYSCFCPVAGHSCWETLTLMVDAGGRQRRVTAAADEMLFSAFPFTPGRVAFSQKSHFSSKIRVVLL